MSVQIIKCFIASPGDTQKERVACDQVFTEINKNLGDIYKFRLEPLKWETDARPSFGADGQDVINTAIGEDYEVFIGIMWKKFGTPTKRAGSGTEEEFDRAYKRYKEKGDIELAIYFNSAVPDSLEDIDPVQFGKVREFKKKVADQGGLYWSYKGAMDFEQHLRTHLSAYLRKRFQEAPLANPSTAATVSADPMKKSIELMLEKRLTDALRSFSSQPTIWIEPILSETNEISENPDENYNNRVPVTTILQSPSSLLIKAPPQFGLTCLANYLVLEAWKKDSLWIYLDSTEVKAHNVENAVKRECESLKLDYRNIKCIVLDSWNLYMDKAFKLLKNLSSAYRNIPIIVMETIDESRFFTEPENENIDRDFNVLHLLALTRTEVRRLVASYNQHKSIGDEDIVLSKLLSDLEILNIHRTPLNCFTLLKVSEKYFDESPVNRTKMLEMVLFILFDMNGVPTYKNKPDVKDCEYVLGKFCRLLIDRKRYEFTREEFLSELKKICQERLISLDIDVVFDILNSNNIIVRCGLNFIFRATYWILYFGAKEMHNDPAFAKKILETKEYVSFPEIIEFYTGIDRKREDALLMLIEDLQETCEIVQDKVRLPDEMNPFNQIKWMPTEESIVKIKEEIGQDVIKSGLPEAVKDQYADSTYNQIRPYNQSIQTILENYSLVVLMQKVKACARALRNSDYVEPDTKRELLKRILTSWEEITKVLLALTPILATRGHAAFEGAGFSLFGDFGDTFEVKVKRIFQALSYNVVKLFKDDIFSNKIGPLLYDHISKEKNELKKHQLILLIAFERPPGWKTVVEDYIISVNKNSFYLHDIVSTLIMQYRYSFATPESLREIEYLIKKGIAKHEYQVNNPGFDKIRNISNKVLHEPGADKSKEI